jgi:hypothetical protein
VFGFDPRAERPEALDFVAKWDKVYALLRVDIDPRQISSGFFDEYIVPLFLDQYRIKMLGLGDMEDIHSPLYQVFTAVRGTFNMTGGPFVGPITPILQHLGCGFFIDPFLEELAQDHNFNLLKIEIVRYASCILIGFQDESQDYMVEMVSFFISQHLESRCIRGKSLVSSNRSDMSFIGCPLYRGSDSSLKPYYRLNNEPFA